MKRVSFLEQVALLKCVIIVFSLPVQAAAVDFNQTTICPQGFEPAENERCLLSQPPFNCPTDLVVLSLNCTDSENQTEFRLVDNFTALRVADSGRLDVLGFSGDGQPLICPNSTVDLSPTCALSFPTFPTGYSVLSYIGCSLSVIGSFLVLLTYGLFKELRTLPGKILMNLATAILLTDLLTQVGAAISELHITVVITVAICNDYFLLAQFVWMCIMSIEVVKKLRQARQLTTTSNHNTRYLVITYILVGWGLPLPVIVAFTILSTGKEGSCYNFPSREAIIILGVVIFLAILFNLIMFITATVYICLASREHKKVQDNGRTRFSRLNIALFSTSGLTWIFYAVRFIENAKFNWAWYLFIIFTTTQGLIICIAFLLSKKTFRLYLKLFSNLKEQCACISIGHQFKRHNQQHEDFV